MLITYNNLMLTRKASKMNERNMWFFQSSYEMLKGFMYKVAEQTMVKLENGGFFLRGAGRHYLDLWPDDFLFPLIVCPELADKDSLSGTATFLTDSIVDLNVVPDRIEPNGFPWMSPGIEPLSLRMPMHLPAAWVRVLRYFESRGVKIPRKDAWARIITRSFDVIPYSMGLAQAERIKTNLFRLYDDRLGGFVAGSKQCRQLDVWGNGIVYGLADEKQRQSIVRFFKDNQDLIFKYGFARQVADEKGWEKTVWPIKFGHYTNGGHWPSGTGWVLPAIYDKDDDFAKQLMTELLENLPKFEFTEFVAIDGELGAFPFCMSVAVPMLAVKCILEKKHIVDFL